MTKQARDKTEDLFFGGAASSGTVRFGEGDWADEAHSLGLNQVRVG
jgi:hypothetical protein